ncbi:hypothetical protein L873DRAFT_1413750 [Choiromyces venosus 120613-1]|uniref:Uncharacterized protein n=1 Tax=Choiromyces venosus 120613-1 TaxID=1336337 RepID=A0A3N4J8J2_9PEZI|nr:hypothetical protein L873DRAFT_1413750 [Choiromyces venosus 120613-1]
MEIFRASRVLLCLFLLLSICVSCQFFDMILKLLNPLLCLGNSPHKTSFFSQEFCSCLAPFW